VCAAVRVLPVNAGAPTVAELAAALGATVRGVRKRAEREAWPFTTEGKQARRYPLETLPEDVRAAILAARREKSRREREAAAAKAEAPRIAAAWAEWAKARPWRKELALVRVLALAEVAALRADGLSLRKAQARVAARLKGEGVAGGCSRPAIQRWSKLVEDVPRPHWEPLLLPAETRGGAVRAEIHPHAWLAFKNEWMRLEQPTTAQCYRVVIRLADVNPDWHPLPSLDTFERRRKTDIAQDAKVYAREGKEAFMKLQPVTRRDVSGLDALEQVSSDGHVFDVMVRYPDGSIGRPIIVGWQDRASGKLLSWRIGKSETAELVRLSLADMVRNYGVPVNATLDNGRAYASKSNTGGMPTRYRYKVKPDDPMGVMVRMGINVNWAKPRNGRAKPIERTWRDFATDISRRSEFAGAYTGSSPDAKPENYGSRAVPWDEFLRVVEDGIAEHNARPGRRGANCNGRSFDETFNDLYARSVPRKATVEQLRLLLLAAAPAKVSKTGHIHLFKNLYWHEDLCPLIGTKVDVRFDPNALQSSVSVYRTDGAFVCEAPCLHPLGFYDQAASREHNRNLSARRKAGAALTAAELALDKSRPDPWASTLPPIQPPAAPVAGVVRLVTPKRKASEAAQPVPDNAVSEIDDLMRRSLKSLWAESI